MVQEAATTAKMNPRVLDKLLPSDAVLEIGEATGEDGTSKKVVSIVQGESKTLLDVYASQNWPEFLPALKAAEEQQPAGTTWIQQQASTAGGAGTNGMHPLLKKKLEEAAKRSQPQK
jgi:hypothetical protein